MLRQWHKNSMVCDSPPSLRNKIPTCWAWQLITFYYLFIDCWALSFLFEVAESLAFWSTLHAEVIDFNYRVDGKLCMWITVDICLESVTACAVPSWFWILTTPGREPRLWDTLIFADQMDPPFLVLTLKTNWRRTKQLRAFIVPPWNQTKM